MSAKPVRMWLDTEFNEHGGDLISIGIAAENHFDFYAVLPCENPGPWVAQHVIPVLASDSNSLGQVRRELSFYLRSFESVHIIADWPIDIAHFCELLITGPGQRIATPKLTFEIDQNLPSTAEISLVPHNALEDARALRDHECRR
jgi:hypothetical protein